jgi:diguanylate cyclase (GGDEF)-like protein/PAS domain S-box-containing protein
MFVRMRIGLPVLMLSCLLLGPPPGRVFASEPVRMGVYHNPPLSYLDEQGRPQGFIIDLFQSIGKRNGWDLEFVPCRFPVCMEQLQQGRLDLLSPIAMSEKRTRILDFNKEPLILNWGRLYVRQSGSLDGILDLEGEAIAVLKGDIHYRSFQKMCQSFGVHTRFIELESYVAVARAVAEGEVVAGLLNRLYGDWKARKLGLNGSPVIFNPIDVVVALPKGTERAKSLLEQIDGELIRMKKDPDSAYYRLLARWLGQEMMVGYPNWLRWVLLGVACLLLLLVTTILLMRLLIRKKTEKLSREIEERKLAEQALQKFSRAVEQSPVSVVITDTEGSIEYVNAAFEMMTGYSRESVLGKNTNILKSGRTAPEIYAELWRQIRAGNEWRGEFCNRKKNGSLYWESVMISPLRDENSRISHFIGIQEDITRRREYEERLLRQANYDEVTGLPNRILLLDRLGQALAEANRQQEGLAALFLDLDDFKKINDTFGHELGDEVLKMAASRFQGILGEAETVARLGGDEFFIILSHVDDVTRVEELVERILAGFSTPFKVRNREVVVTTSIGICRAPFDGKTPQELVKNAEAAMYLAKHAGKNSYRFFTPELNKQAERRLDLENRLRYALKQNELSLVYQPLVVTEDGRPVGAEALLRWTDDKYGHVSPEEFIPLAESTGLINGIGEWVLDSAIDQARQWEFVVGEPLRMAVNISPRQLAQPGFCQSVSRLLQQYGFPAEKLELEITERILLADDSTILSQLEQLDRLNVRLSVDDFGTGYSALSYLKRFPVDTVKIDRSFVGDMATDRENEILVRTIIAMGHGLGLEVIAEGVEEEEQMTLLREKGCDLAQGYLFSPPISALEFNQWLRKHWRH